MRDFPVVPEKGGDLPYKGNVQHTTVGKGMFPEEINHRRVRVVSERTLFDTHCLLLIFSCRRRLPLSIKTRIKINVSILGE
jgi:hypothetical protein